MALEGKPEFLKNGIEVLENNLKDIDDKFLIGCHINNIACSRWWLNISSILSEISNAKVMDSNNVELFKKLANESVEIIKMFKKAVLSLEGIEFSVDNEFDYLEEKKKISLEEKSEPKNFKTNNDAGKNYFNFRRFYFSK